MKPQKMVETPARISQEERLKEEQKINAEIEAAKDLQK